jgi:predicted nucleotidyltransferase
MRNSAPVCAAEMRTRGPGESALLLLDVVEVLDQQRIDYAVIGATAATIYGSMRSSADADVVLSLALSEAADLEAKLKLLGLATELNLGDFDDPIPGMLRVRDTHENQVDLLVGLKGLESQAFARVVQIEFEGVSLRFIGIEDFIAMKLFAGGPIDLMDARRALIAKRSSIDLQMLRQITGKYGRSAAGALETLLAAES